MAIEVRPFGVKCNIQCEYCYQDAVRKAGDAPQGYDLERIKAAIETAGSEFTLFGGEPLMMPLADLQALWSWGYQKYGRNSVQTNAVLITRRHVELFKKYKVHVGISVDGPDELNSARRAGNAATTLRATKKTHAAISLLVNEGIIPSIIVTLHRANADATKLPLLIKWIRHLDDLGIRAVRLHVLEVENAEVRDKYALSHEQNLAAFRRFLQLERELSVLRFDVFNEMRRLLTGSDHSTTCVWNACDPYTTRAVQGIEGHGQRSNCGRTNKDGVDFVKADRQGFERYIALYHTPQEVGGCKGCRFFLVCRGQCPGTAIDGDWRNRTEHCALWTSLYEDLEADLLKAGNLPLSQRADRQVIENEMLRQWASGRTATLESVIEAVGGSPPELTSPAQTGERPGRAPPAN
jgi:uncharacterized protein